MPLFLIIPCDYLFIFIYIIYLIIQAGLKISAEWFFFFNVWSENA